MSRPELAIVALVYLAALVLAPRAIGVVAPTAQEAGFAVAAIAGGLVAAVLYQRRAPARPRASASVKLSVGLLMAMLAVGVGLVTWKLWYATLRPQIALPI